MRNRGQVSLYMDDDERRIALVLAERRGLPLSAFIRNMIREQARREGVL